MICSLPRAVLAFLFAVTTAVSVASSQQPPSQSAQPQTPPQSATPDPKHLVQGRLVEKRTSAPIEGVLVSIVKPRPSAEPDENCEPATTQKNGSFKIETSKCIKNFMVQIADPQSRFWPIFYEPASFSPYPLDLRDIQVSSMEEQLSAESLKDVIQILTNLRNSNPEVARLVDSALSKQKETVSLPTGWKLDVAAGVVDLDVGPAPNVNGYSLVINNYSGIPLNGVYVSRFSSANWGQDELGEERLESHGSVTVTNLDPKEHYNVMVVDQDGDSCVINDIFVPKSKALNITPGWLLSCEYHTHVR